MISKTAIYGIRAMLALAGLPRGEYAGASKLAALADVPPSYLSKLLQVLARAGVVRSQRGVTGGFELARDPAEISLYDIVEPLDPIERWSGCFLGHRDCSDEFACSVHHRWKDIQRATVGMLRRSTLADPTAGAAPADTHFETVLNGPSQGSHRSDRNQVFADGIA